MSLFDCAVLLVIPVEARADDEDEDGFDDDEDCDDDDDDVNPGADERCNGVDDDCDDEVDEPDAIDADPWWRDEDGDGWGDPTRRQQGCEAPPGHVPRPDDCDDGDAERNPDATETCNGFDDDCDVEIDEGCEPVDTAAPEQKGKGGKGGKHPEEEPPTDDPPSTTTEVPPTTGGATPGDPTRAPGTALRAQDGAVAGCGCAAGRVSWGWAAVLVGVALRARGTRRP